MHHGDWLARRATCHPDRIALRDLDRGEVLDYAALSARADGAARALIDLGVGRGDRVAVLGCNRLEQIELYFACGRLGAILVPVNWRLAPPEVAGILEDAEPRVLLYGDDVAETLAALERLPPTVCFDASDGGLSWSERRDAHRGESLTPETLRADTPALILYTSGSTGLPKGAVLTHGSITWNAVNTSAGWDLRADDVTLCHTPLFHTGGWNVLTLPLLHQGGTVLLTRGFEPRSALAAIARHGVSVLFAVPTMFGDLLAAHREAPADLSSLRWAISGGAACPLAVIEAFGALGVRLKQGYGLTEVGPNCFVFPDGHEATRAGSVGVPMPHLQVRLVDGEGSEVAWGDVGELQLRGPTVCAGYWRRPEASAAAIDGDGWFSTGDLLRADPDGWYAVVGRKKEMFISGGENVYPAEVERVLTGIPGIAEAVVLPEAHARWGEVGHAFVAFAASARSRPDGEAIRALCRAQLAGYKVPKAVTVLPALPRGPTGKISRLDLAARLRPTPSGAP